MEIFQTVAVILGLTALFGVVNERLLGPQRTIGLMVIALAAVALAYGAAELTGLSGPIATVVLGLAVAMALSLPEGPEKGLILHMTYGVVVFSLVAQGLSIGRIFKADRLKQLLGPAS